VTAGADMVLCGGLGPAEEPGTWRPCRLEEGHNSPCMPVPDPVRAELVKLRSDYQGLADCYRRTDDALDRLMDEMDRLRDRYHEKDTEFGRAVRWVVDCLDAALEGRDRPHP